jgi:hypothetical protein
MKKTTRTINHLAFSSLALSQACATTIVKRMAMVADPHQAKKANSEKVRMIAEKQEATLSGVMKAQVEMMRFYQSFMFGKIRNMDDLTTGILHVSKAAFAPTRTRALSNGRRFRKK